MYCFFIFLNISTFGLRKGFICFSNDNLKGATILYGEGLGRLKSTGIPTLGLDIENLTEIVEQRLKILQEGRDVFNVSEPKLLKR